MPRPTPTGGCDNQPLKITLAWPLYEYLDRAITLGFYGATHTSAAERAIEKHIEHLIAEGEIKKMTPAELANPPKDKI